MIEKKEGEGTRIEREKKRTRERRKKRGVCVFVRKGNGDMSCSDSKSSCRLQRSKFKHQACIVLASFGKLDVGVYHIPYSGILDMCVYMTYFIGTSMMIVKPTKTFAQFRVRIPSVWRPKTPIVGNNFVKYLIILKLGCYVK